MLVSNDSPNPSDSCQHKTSLSASTINLLSITIHINWLFLTTKYLKKK
ncbi:hypothetical protein VIC_004360 [Vibrio coralliilyticus ATCC BAA-450]|nr:hypothetical protein VIC_004360 [Vibrio coralliilyticus ATCC BAA-450]